MMLHGDQNKRHCNHQRLWHQRHDHDPLSFLIDLPIDAMDLITRHLSSWDIGSLMQTSRTLADHVASSVTRFDHRIYEPKENMYKFPSQIRKMHRLQYLKIDIYNMIMLLTNEDAEYMNTTNAMIEARLNCMMMVSTWSSVCPWPSVRPWRYQPRCVRSLTTTDRQVLSVLPLTLKSLVVVGAGIDLVDSHIAHLPSTLTHLNLKNCTQLTTECIGTLPIHLTELHLSDFSNLTDVGLSLLPRSLIRLHIESIGRNITPVGMMNLPRSLTYLKWNLPYLTNAHVSHMPRALQSLHTDGRDLDDSTMIELPRQMTELSFRWSSNLRDGCVDHLPKTLTLLKLPFAPHLTDDCVAQMPNNLIKLILTFTDQLTDRCVPHLPKHLTKLDIFSAHMTDECIRHLPRSLTKLRLKIVQISQRICEIDWPAGLLDLDLSSTCTASLDLNLLHLPKRLTRLCINRCKNLNASSVQHLPRTMTDLDLHIDDDTQPQEQASGLMRYLPNGLKRFNLTGYPIMDADIADLPRGLLDLQLCDNLTLTDACFTWLPPELKELDLSRNPHFTHKMVPLLPRTLTCLVIILDRSEANNDLRHELKQRFSGKADIYDNVFTYYAMFQKSIDVHPCCSSI